MAHTELSKKFDLDSTFVLKTVNNAIVASATTVTGTPHISMEKSHYMAFVCIPIDANLAGKISAWVFEATASTTGTKTATALKSTTWGAGTTDAGVVKVLEVEASELDVANGYTHVTLKVKTAGADSFACTIIRGPNRYDPASLV